MCMLYVCSYVLPVLIYFRLCVCNINITGPTSQQIKKFSSRELQASIWSALLHTVYSTCFYCIAQTINTVQLATDTAAAGTTRAAALTHKLFVKLAVQCQTVYACVQQKNIQEALDTLTQCINANIKQLLP